jgi:hypothetical protein
MSNFSQQAQESYVTTGLREVARLRNPLTPQNVKTIEEQIALRHQQYFQAGQTHGYSSSQAQQLERDIERLQLQKYEISKQSQPVIPPGSFTPQEQNSPLSILGRLINAFRTYSENLKKDKNSQELLNETQDLQNNQEIPRQIFIPKASNDNKGSPDSSAVNYDPTATEDNAKSVYNNSGPAPIIDIHSEGSADLPSMSNSVRTGGCGWGSVNIAYTAINIFFGIWQAVPEGNIKNLLRRFATMLGLGYGPYANGIRRVYNEHNQPIDSQKVAEMERFQAEPNASYGDRPLLDILRNASSTSSPTNPENRYSRNTTPEDYIESDRNPYIPNENDPSPLRPSPNVPDRNEPPSVVRFKPGNLLFLNGTGTSIPGNLSGNNCFLRINPYNRTYTSCNPNNQPFNQPISDTIFFDDHDGVNLYINGERSEDIQVIFEHGKAIKFDCTRLSRRNAIAIYKTLVPSVSGMESFDYDNMFWYSQYSWNEPSPNYRGSHRIIFNNNPYNGVYNGSIYMDISAYLRNINSYWTMRYGCVYNHLYPNFPGFKNGPAHDHKAIWYYKVTNNPSISGKIIFIPKDDMGTTFHLTLTTVSANNIEYKKYAVSNDNMRNWFIPTNDKKLILSYTNPFISSFHLLSAFTYTFILTNIPSSDAVYLGGVSKGFSEFVLSGTSLNRRGTVIANFLETYNRNNLQIPANYGIRTETYCVNYVYRGDYGWVCGSNYGYAYKSLGTYATSGLNYKDYGKIKYNYLVTGNEYDAPEENVGIEPITFYYTNFGAHSACTLGVAIGQPLSSTGHFPVTATAPLTYIDSNQFSPNLTAPFGFINLRYFNQFRNQNNLTGIASISAVQLAGQYTDQNFCIGYDKNSIPLSYREPYIRRIRPASRVQSSTRWWNSVGIWGANGLSYDFDYEENHNPNSFRKRNLNVKFFVKTATQTNPLGSYRMIRDFYVQGKIPPIIGRFFVSSNLIGSKIGINFSGGNEPEIVATVQPSAPEAQTTMFFTK